MPEQPSTGRRRPAPDYVTDRVTRAVHAATWLVVVAGLGTVAVRYPDLPATVPVHVDLSGRADDVGPRSSVLWLAALWLVLQGGISALSRRPDLFNYTVPVTEDNAQRVYREGERLMVWLGASIAVAFLGALLAVIAPGSAGLLLVAVGVAGSLVLCVVGGVRSHRAGTPPPPPSERAGRASRP
jgi:hypothetical protein